VDANGNCQVLCAATRGERVLLSYSVDLARAGAFTAPVAATLVCECDADYNRKVNLTVALQNTVQHRGVQHVTLEVRPPLRCVCEARRRASRLPQVTQPSTPEHCTPVCVLRRSARRARAAAAAEVRREGVVHTAAQ
jgi:hypothetical protein